MTEEKRKIEFKSYVQEELSLAEILHCLLPTAGSALNELRSILTAVVEKQCWIFDKFKATNRKLAFAFIHCTPNKKSLSHIYGSDKVTTKTIFKLAVLFDVYKRSVEVPCETVERVFEPVMAAVENAKAKARQQRKHRFYRRVDQLIDGIAKYSLQTAAIVASASCQSNETSSSSECTNDYVLEREKSKAIRRYRLLLGIGGQAVSREQIVRVIYDLLRMDPHIQVPAATAALDQVLGT